MIAFHGWKRYSEFSSSKSKSFRFIVRYIQEATFLTWKIFTSNFFNQLEKGNAVTTLTNSKGKGRRPHSAPAKQEKRDFCFFASLTVGLRDL